MNRSSSPKKLYNNFVSGKLSVYFVVCFIVSFLFFTQSLLCQSNWTPLNSPGGGNINTIFKVWDSIFIAGVQHGSLYRTSNVGAIWEKVHSANNTYGNQGVDCFLFNSNYELLVGTFIHGIMRSTDMGLTWLNTNCGGGDYIVNTESGFMLSFDNANANWRLAKSLDSGKTWIAMVNPFVNRVYSIESFFNTIYVGISNSIKFSVDSGVVWQNYGNLTSGTSRINSILILSENEIMIGTNKGIYYTSNHGNDWVLRNSGIPANALEILQLQFFGDTIFACGKAGILYTNDLGNQWIHYNDYKFQYEVNSLAISDDLLLASTNTGIYKIESNTWIPYSNNLFGLTPRSLSSTSNNDIIYSTSSGIYRSTNAGESWNVLDLEDFYARCTFINKGNFYVVQASDFKFYLSTDYGSEWNNTGIFEAYSTGMTFSRDNNNIYLGYFISNPNGPPGTGFRYSTNFGETWLYVPHVYTWDNFSKVVSIPGNIVFADVYDVYNGHEIGLYRRSFPSGTWIETNSGLPSKSNKYLASDNSYELYVSQNSGIYKLDRSDYLWHLYAGNLNNVEYIGFNDYNHIIAVNSGKIFASVNGKNWDYASTGLDDKIIKICGQHSDGHYIAADNSGRLYKTLTPYLINQLPLMPELVYPINNQHVVPDTINFLWKSSRPLVMQYLFELSNDSLFNSFLDTLLTDTSLTILDLEFGQNYYWRVKAFNEVGYGNYSSVGAFTTNPTSVKNEVDEYLFEFSLLQNFPNPFNPTTIIKFTIPQADNPLTGGAKSGLVTLKVYDVLGNKISTLVNEEKPAGEYKVEFNASELPSGIYFYQLKSDSFTETKKMVLMK